MPLRRPRRPPQRREIDALQPPHAVRAARSSRRSRARRATSSRSRSSGRAPTSSWSTPAACSARARIRCTRSCSSAGGARSTTADLLVLVVDGREGLVPGDRDIAKVIREADKPALLAINKTDDKRSRSGVLEFYQLGFDPVFEISAEHGDGIGDLLDAIVETALRHRGHRHRGSRRSAETAGRAADVGSPSSAGRTPASRRWSIGCCARSA